LSNLATVSFSRRTQLHAACVTFQFSNEQIMASKTTFLVLKKGTSNQYTAVDELAAQNL
jgi:hypothetical protein